MLTHQRANLIISAGGVGVALFAGYLAGVQPLYVGLVLGGLAIAFYFFTSFESAVLGLLILRSALDPFSLQQVPAAFAIGLDVLTLIYVVATLLTNGTVQTDGFWWLFAGWVVLQGLWVLLLLWGDMSLNTAVWLDSIREWVRLFSWLMVYLLVMQLKDRIHPQKMISALFLALILPLTAALLQILLPLSLLPDFLQGNKNSITGEISRINGTLGLSNTFATFLLLFIGLTYWQMNQSQRRWPWWLLLALLAFFYVSTKALFSLMMLGVFILVLIAPKLSLINLMAGVLFFVVVIALFGSTEFGQQRLGSLSQTPLLNPDIDISRAILLSQGDGNSFNWRLAQWSLLLKAWEDSPILGYGLATSRYLTIYNNYAHNDYVRALAEGGILGFLVFIAFLGTQLIHLMELLRRSPANSPQHQLCWVLLALLVAIMVGMTTENILTHTTLFFYWWTVVAIAGWNWNQPQSYG
ncbi:O-antigen ligase family protein [Cylindrospermum sp. FACHB-282]|uniref:O-antigen ligase family protein n=1 Tax=Cylindrospermum sp. FACHB-282 TaxID=2692794 RepID=UPI0016849F26|nr:O-antigen ligase family protein [Cylindrospermum sp. FACHB-282]MBD2388330.1 O-antigen ligase family protein [Cylindrospermum sp. FACHB-282]